MHIHIPTYLHTYTHTYIHAYVSYAYLQFVTNITVNILPHTYTHITYAQCIYACMKTYIHAQHMHT